MPALVCSGRPEVAGSAAAELRRVAELEGGRPAVEGGGAAPSRLVLLDLGSEGVSAADARRRLGPEARLVALVDSESADRLVPALAAGCGDYLFHPINRSELRLLWRRHLEGDRDAILLPGSLEQGRLRVEFPSQVRYLQAVVDRIVEGCREVRGVDGEGLFRLRVALGEAVTNAILYGNREDPTRRVAVEVESAPGALRVSVSDEGDGFDPSAVPDPRLEENRGRAHGRGLFLLRTLMDEVRHNEVGNRVTLVLRTSRRDPAPEPRPGGPG